MCAWAFKLNERAQKGTWSKCTKCAACPVRPAPVGAAFCRYRIAWHEVTWAYTDTAREERAGLTKLVSQLGKEGAPLKALEVYAALPCLGILPDTAITNAAISACDKGNLSWGRGCGHIGGYLCPMYCFCADRLDGIHIVLKVRQTHVALEQLSPHPIYVHPCPTLALWLALSRRAMANGLAVI